MKFLIIGLGIFGTSLAEKLTQMGHEVIGVDKQIEKVEDIKDRIAYAICLDTTHQAAVKSLPLKDTDVVIVCIGEDEGANLLTSALMKKMKVERLISRSASPIHELILEAMEVSEIVSPEEETAERWAKKLTTTGVIDSFELSNKYSIMEIKVPKQFSGKSIHEIGFNEKHNILVLTVLKDIKETNPLGVFKDISKLQIQGIAKADTILYEDDIMVLYGNNKDIQNLLKE